MLFNVYYLIMINVSEIKIKFFLIIRYDNKFFVVLIFVLLNILWELNGVSIVGLIKLI